MSAVFLEFTRTTADEAQLGIRIKATVLHPAAEKEVLAGNPEPGQLLKRAIVASFRASALCGLVYFL